MFVNGCVLYKWFCSIIYPLLLRTRISIQAYYKSLNVNPCLCEAMYLSDVIFNQSGYKKSHENL